MPKVITIPASDTPEGAAARFPHQAEVVVLLFGTLEAALAARVRSIFARALIPVALYAEALIVDDGSSDGLAARLGIAAQQLDRSPALLGIMPPGTSAADPNHADVMSLPPEWPDPAKSSFQIAASLAEHSPGGTKAAFALLIGGDDAGKLTALRCARRGWPLLAVRGAGGLGDRLLTAQDAAQAAQPLADPDLQEILDTGVLRELKIDGDTDTLKRLLLAPIQKPGEILMDIWSRFDDLDECANRKQRLFRRTQIAILALSVFATLMAILVTKVASIDRTQHPRIHSFGEPLHILMILIPIAISLLVGLSARFREGNKWILSRAAAEAIKQHTFRYRTRSGAYGPGPCATMSAPMRLASNIRDITTNLVRTEINRVSIPKRKVAKDRPGKPLSDRQKKALVEREKRIVGRAKFLSPQDYLRERVEDQIGYFSSKTKKLYRQLRRLQIGVLLVGGLGTFLAALQFDVWVALTTALATAFAGKLELDQVENSLIQYNTALTNLLNIQFWWKGLSPWERSRQNNIDLLVDQTETTLEHDTAGWVQKMQSTLDKLTEKQPGTEQSSDANDKSG
jgi:hypothetical protein